jgi:hypothetical protein
MSRKFHKFRCLYTPSLLVKPARWAAGDMDPIAEPSVEPAGKEFADENSRLRQTIRSDRNPSAVVMALICPDRREIDLLSQPVGPTTMVAWRS